MESRGAIVHLLSVFLGKVAPWLVLAYIAYLSHQAILLLAQGGGAVHPYLHLIATVNRARSFAFLLGILGVVYGLVQRELRRRAEADFAAKLRELSTGGFSRP
jgi:hypothetical protein